MLFFPLPGDAGEIGSRLPKGCRDAVFLRNCLIALHGDFERRLTVTGGAPIALSCTAPGSTDTAAIIFPVDLARYPQERIQAWVRDTACPRVIVLHGRSATALRSAGYGGDIGQLPAPELLPAPAAKRDDLQLAGVFRCLDSRERHYDPAWLMPGYAPPAAVTAIEPPPAPAASRPAPRPGLRFRLGATKRHLLNLVAELREPPPAVDESAPSSAPRQPLNLTFDGTLFTMVIDEFSDESGWVDVVKAFSAAFRQRSDVTLLIFLWGDADEQHARDFDHVLCALPLFSCRLLLVQGTLAKEEYGALVACTDVYVDAGRRQTLHADLRCFAAAGIRTVGFSLLDEAGSGAVDHLLKYCSEPAVCDFGDDPRYRTEVRRLDWESLLAALTDAQAATEGANAARLPRSHLPQLDRPSAAWRQALSAAAP